MVVACCKLFGHVAFVLVENDGVSPEQAFGRRVNEWRLANRWSQEELARRMTEAGYPMHQTMVAKMERGTRPTSVGEIAALTTIFDVPVEMLFGSSAALAARMNITAFRHRLTAIDAEEAQLRKRIAELDEERAATAEALDDAYRELAGLDPGFEPDDGEGCGGVIPPIPATTTAPRGKAKKP